MVDTELPQGIEASENERTQVLERFYVIRPFWKMEFPWLKLRKNELFPDGP